MLDPDVAEHEREMAERGAAGRRGSHSVSRERIVRRDEAVFRPRWGWELAKIEQGVEARDVRGPCGLHLGCASTDPRRAFSRRPFSAPTSTPSPDESMNETWARSSVMLSGPVRAALRARAQERRCRDVDPPAASTTGCRRSAARCNVSGTAAACGSGSWGICSPGNPAPAWPASERVSPIRARRPAMRARRAPRDFWSRVGDVHLADADLVRDLGLREPGEEPQVHDLLLPFGQHREQRAHRNSGFHGVEVEIGRPHALGGRRATVVVAAGCRARRAGTGCSLPCSRARLLRQRRLALRRSRPWWVSAQPPDSSWQSSGRARGATPGCGGERAPPSPIVAGRFRLSLDRRRRERRELQSASGSKSLDCLDETDQGDWPQVVEGFAMQEAARNSARRTWSARAGSAARSRCRVLDEPRFDLGPVRHHRGSRGSSAHRHDRAASTLDHLEHHLITSRLDREAIRRGVHDQREMSSSSRRKLRNEQGRAHHARPSRLVIIVDAHRGRSRR